MTPAKPHIKEASKPLVVLSLGAGVQSSTMALMAEHGEIQRPDFAIFADTGWEPKAIYEYLDWLESRLSFPVIRVSKGNIREDLLEGCQGDRRRFSSVPFFTGNGGMGRRQCTREYKISPIQKELRSRGATAKNPITLMIGISLDEIVRMKPSRVKYARHIWPLIELGMTRQDCLRWMAKNGYRLPSKSSCIGCPYHDNEHWRGMKLNDPESWFDAVFMDRIIRNGGKNHKELQFMHRSLLPLDRVDLRNAKDHGQIDMFDNECEGMCGI